MILKTTHGERVFESELDLRQELLKDPEFLKLGDVRMTLAVKAGLKASSPVSVNDCIQLGLKEFEIMRKVRDEI